MDYEAGFDMVPPLTKEPRDQEKWEILIDIVQSIVWYKEIMLFKSNYIEFNIGDHPKIPFEGHKFLSFRSKISNIDPGQTKDMIEEIWVYAMVVFDSRARYWSNKLGGSSVYSWQDVHDSETSYDKRDLQREEKPSTEAPLWTGPNPLEYQHLYSIQSTPGKGKGLIACTRIARGTRVLMESPLFTVTNLALTGIMENDIATKLKSLSKNPFSGIVKTSALPCGPDSHIGCVYPTISLINHSCLANTNNNWNGVAGHETIHAVRDIEEGEEITTSYDRGETSTVRRLRLKDAFGFDCTCPLCVLPPDQVEASDARRVQIDHLDSSIGNASTVLHKPDDALAACRSLAALLKEEYDVSVGIRLARTYYDAFQICITHGDQARAAVFAKLAYEVRVVCEGEDSPAVGRVKGFMANPKSHRNFGTSMRWRTEKTMVPKGLDDEAFDQWLWRQGK